MPIRVLLLDAGGTLVFPNLGRIAETFGHTDPAALAALARAEARVRFDLDCPKLIGSSTDGDRWERYLSLLAQAAGLPPARTAAVAELRQIHQTRNLWDFVPEGVPEALASLQREFRLGVVSNANGTVRALLHRVGLARFFEHIVDSHEEGVEKPDPRLFHVGLARMKAYPDETAYVGDLYHVDILGARSAGLHAVLLDPHDWYADRDCLRARSMADFAARRAALLAAPSAPVRRS